jgi:hypothetical protein
MQEKKQVNENFVSFGIPMSMPNNIPILPITENDYFIIKDLTIVENTPMVENVPIIENVPTINGMPIGENVPIVE